MIGSVSIGEAERRMEQSSVLNADEFGYFLVLMVQEESSTIASGVDALESEEVLWGCHCVR